jgi:hypothetical protein
MRPTLDTIAAAAGNAASLWQASDGYSGLLLLWEAAEDLPNGDWTWTGDASGTPKGAAGAGGALLRVLLRPRADGVAAIEEWYEQEHIPLLARVPGVVAARRYTPRAHARDFLALYELTEPQVCTSAAWRDASRTEWAAAMRPFIEKSVRWVGERTQASQPTAPKPLR